MYRPREEGPSRINIAHEDIREIVENYDPRLSTAQAYLGQIRERLAAGRGWRFDKPETIYPYIKAANLPQKPEFEQALADAWARSAFLRSMAGDEAVWEQFLVEGHLDIVSANTYGTIIADLGKKQRWQLNTQAQEAAERSRMIANIIGAK